MSRPATPFAAGPTWDRTPADSGLRVDPAALPQRFCFHTGLEGEAALATATLDRGQVRVRRRLPSGIPMVLSLPMRAFEGVAVRFEPSPGYSADGLRAVLELRHRDPALSVPLAIAEDARDVVADWRSWGRVLGLPLLVAEADASLTVVEERLGGLSVQPAKPRRRRSVLAQRRPRFLVRRQPGDPTAVPQIVAGEEISAWD
ncbi:DUF6101 family protein [Prosthecomicrobium sp. N25]|uniref:DUF6101 family protein n=1 Tax=Prosthecomicrobium sp. N25 TaxID=3129254 RepID=UPI0030775386